MKEYEQVMEDVSSRHKGFARWKSETFSSHEVWQEYIVHLQQIDLEGCPEDFQQAFEKHLDAARELMKAKKELGGTSAVTRRFYKFFVSKRESKAEKADRELTEKHRQSYRDLMTVANQHLNAPVADHTSATP